MTPVGSALAGSAAFVGRARRFRKMFGGGMRQAGIIAAGVLYALEHHRARLADDHANARRLAEGLAGMPGVDLAPATVETNIVVFGVVGRPAAEVVAAVAEQGVRVLATGPQMIRAVTHLDVSADQIEAALAAFGKVMGE